MAHSIESRVPFLDYRLVDFIFSSPWKLRIHRASRKAIIRSAMKGVLPESVISRRDKVPFPSPANTWLRAQSDGGVADIIHSQSFRERPYFNMNAVDKLFKEYRHGRRNTAHIIWRWIIFELWLRAFIDQRAPTGNRGTGPVHNPHP